VAVAALLSAFFLLFKSNLKHIPTPKQLSRHVRRNEIPQLPTVPTMKKCIALGMFTRSVEFDLRKWHREVFQKHANSHRFSGSVDIHLRFGTAAPSDDLEVMDQLNKEVKLHHDLIVYDFKETEKCMPWNRCLMRNQDSLFRGIQHLCDGDNYDGSYFIKVDNDSVLNYNNLAQVFMDLPNESLLVGRLLPNTPLGQLERLLTSSTPSFYPVWPHGSFQGFSKDIFEKTLKPENTATVLRQDVGYVFVNSDRATGMQLERAQIVVKNKVFLKGMYYMCSSEHFTCDAYWNSIAFHSGFGWSGKGTNKMAKKIQMMDRIHKIQQQCNPPDQVFHPADHYFFVNQDFLQNGNTSYWLSYGCSTITEGGLRVLRDFDKKHTESEKTLGPSNGICADQLYEKQWSLLEAASGSMESIPENQQLGITEGRVGDFSSAFLKKMKIHILNRVANSEDPHFRNRLRFIQDGHRSNSLQYYCPDGCEVDGSNLKECIEDLSIEDLTYSSSSSCDLEEEYVRRYPDVLAAVERGDFDSGFHHFTKHGSMQGRVWSCQSKYVENFVLEFIRKAIPLMVSWPVTGDKDFQVNPPRCNALVIADGRDHDEMTFVLKNHRRYLGPYWMFYLIGPKHVTDIWRVRYSGPMITIVDLPDHLGNLSDYPADYNRLLLSNFLWKQTIQCENVLVSQTDAILFRHGVGDFFRYDYVGAPIYPESVGATRYWSIMNAYSSAGVGGNGGLSFRKRSAVIRALDKCEIPIPGSPEDAWMSACIMLLDGVLPHPTIANRFSVGTKCEVDVPFGIHKPWMNCKKSTFIQALLSSKFHKDLYGEENFNYDCPEGELLYLLLHRDVAYAVEHGKCASGWDHYNKHGRLEKGRTWRCLGYHSNFRLTQQV